MDTQEVGAMREQFARFLDYVNDKANEAGLVSGLQSQVNELRERIAQLEQQNYRLQQELNTVNDRANSYEEALRNEEANSRRATDHADALRHSIVEADARVSGLSMELTIERDSHRITAANLEDSRRAITEWEQKATDLKIRLGQTGADLDEWRQRSQDWEKRCYELQGKLDRVMSVLNPAIVTDVASVS